MAYGIITQFLNDGNVIKKFAVEDEDPVSALNQTIKQCEALKVQIMRERMHPAMKGLFTVGSIAKKVLESATGGSSEDLRRKKLEDRYAGDRC